jgi:hypothetical protein
MLHLRHLLLCKIVRRDKERDSKCNVLLLTP